MKDMDRAQVPGEAVEHTQTFADGTRRRVFVTGSKRPIPTAN